MIKIDTPDKVPGIITDKVCLLDIDGKLCGEPGIHEVKTLLPVPPFDTLDGRPINVTKFEEIIVWLCEKHHNDYDIKYMISIGYI